MMRDNEEHRKNSVGSTRNHVGKRVGHVVRCSQRTRREEASGGFEREKGDWKCVTRYSDGRIGNRKLQKVFEASSCCAKIGGGQWSKKSRRTVCKRQIRASTLSGTISTNARITRQIYGRQTIGWPQRLVKEELVRDWENESCSLIVVLKKLEVVGTPRWETSGSWETVLV